ncbi:hypothetical protein POX_b02798 [Penicillium oxalicum]|uniref:Uncharacterized protein n=1 Tax=Penicillium oxalicum (strain 114-2 / CGMCC 5302) TaxID=933388 RepID=S8B6C1_PENO1|nr:hypothetical protein POX_b02798 [Penicillium oxalicum]EPS30192.1 hypothetical protein PDE_05142 [Penicillium oxalicum 114-2]KAI2792755.1 hypothetical protein POX_b02798 [Penicillium oxalicum]
MVRRSNKPQTFILFELGPVSAVTRDKDSLIRTTSREGPASDLARTLRSRDSGVEGRIHDHGMGP